MHSTRSKVGGIIIIPGSGEYIYDSQPVFKLNDKDEILYCANGVIDAETKQVKAIYATSNLQKLNQELPNNSWVGLTVSWFGHFKGADQSIQKSWGNSFAPLDQCSIVPKVEFSVGDLKNTRYTKAWNVAGKSRKDVPCIQRIDSNSSELNYGGSPNDVGVCDYLNLLKNRYKVMLYPFLMLDTVHKTWRGLLKLQAADDLYDAFCKGQSKQSLKQKSREIKEQVIEFFTKSDGYNNFILHYARLSSPFIDAFLIGSEMVSLTDIAVFNENDCWEFPAIDCLIDLAAQVKQIFTTVGKPEILVSYAADWTEYHHSKKDKAKIYPLDKLWACPHIDFIGIDAYFPLTDIAGNITYDDIYNGWTSGNQWDYYKIGDQFIHYTNQTFALKAIKYWWENEHIDLDGKPTNWIPKSKPIWFTELGCASCDHSSNSPNIFLHSGVGNVLYTQYKLDLEHQDNAISASLDYIANNLSDIIQNVFIYNWDARYIDEDPRYIKMLEQAKIGLKSYDFETKKGKSNFKVEDITFCAPSFIDLSDWILGHWICAKLLGYKSKVTDKVNLSLKEQEEEFGDLLNTVENHGLLAKGFLYESHLHLFPFAYPNEAEFLHKQIKEYGIKASCLNQNAGKLILPCNQKVILRQNKKLNSFDYELEVAQNHYQDLSTWMHYLYNPLKKNHEIDLKIEIKHASPVTFLEFFVSVTLAKYYMNYPKK